MGSYVRVYFCYRLYVISKARWAVALVASTDAVSLGFIVAAVCRPLSSIRRVTSSKYLKGYYLHSEDGAMILDCKVQTRTVAEFSLNPFVKLRSISPSYSVSLVALVSCISLMSILQPEICC